MLPPLYPRAHGQLVCSENVVQLRIRAQPPLGFWDPLNILGEHADEERFERLRFVENKHGRISMLAILGHLVTTAGVRLPGEVAYGLGFDQIPTGLKAFDVLPSKGPLPYSTSSVSLSWVSMPVRTKSRSFCAAKSGFDEETLAKKKAIELNNGRAAQMGILALMVHEKLDNNPYIINSLLGFPVNSTLVSKLLHKTVEQGEK